MRLLKTLTLAAALFCAACSAAITPAARGEDNPPRWITGSAIYEVFTRDFTPEGNFQGVVRNLDRVQATGANVIWLMPVHPIGAVNRKGPLGSSYSVRDYRAINPDYGNEADFRALVRAVHARGMKLIIDWVPNHTAWDHVWVTAHPHRYVRNERGE